MTKQRKNIQKEITAQIVADMEKGDLIWERNFNKGGLNSFIPKNLTTGREYRGFNIISLWFQNSSTNHFCTFKQAKENGTPVKKGSKGSKIVFFSTYEKENEKGEKEKRFALKAYTVFAAEDLEGVDCDFEKHDNPELIDANSMLALLGADVEFSESSAAFYRPSEDKIFMPVIENFTSSEGFYQTLFHELIHWTGRRVEREAKIKKFGDEEYAFEELVAELGAAFLSARYGLEYTTQHAAYIKHWIQLFKDHDDALMKAANLAQKAVDYIVEKVDSAKVYKLNTEAV
ncbi:MAG: ArdC family protein [Planctomycetota bacterium]|jgi:antirestriction protein ArdC